MPSFFVTVPALLVFEFIDAAFTLTIRQFWAAPGDTAIIPFDD